MAATMSSGLAHQTVCREFTILLRFASSRCLWLLFLMLMLSVSAISLTLRDAVFEPVVSVFSEFTPSPFDAREQRSEQAPVEAVIAFNDILQIAGKEADKRGWRKLPYSIFYNASYGIFGVGYGDNQGLGAWYLYFDGATGAYLGNYLPGNGTGGGCFRSLAIAAA